MGHIAHLRKQFKSLNKYVYIITLIQRRKKKTLWEFIGSSFEQTWIPFNQGCFVPSLVEIDWVVLEKKILKFRQCIFTICVIISSWKRAGPFIWTNWNPLHSRMLCAKIGWNWLSCSGEEDFKISSMHFHYFIIISPWKREGPLRWAKNASNFDASPIHQCKIYDVTNMNVYIDKQFHKNTIVWFDYLSKIFKIQQYSETFLLNLNIINSWISVWKKIISFIHWEYRSINKSQSPFNIETITNLLYHQSSPLLPAVETALWRQPLFFYDSLCALVGHFPVW